jgi:hypothetical protein
MEAKLSALFEKRVEKVEQEMRMQREERDGEEDERRDGEEDERRDGEEDEKSDGEEDEKRDGEEDCRNVEGDRVSTICCGPSRERQRSTKA